MKATNQQITYTLIVPICILLCSISFGHWGCGFPLQSEQNPTEKKTQNEHPNKEPGIQTDAGTQEQPTKETDNQDARNHESQPDQDHPKEDTTRDQGELPVILTPRNIQQASFKTQQWKLPAALQQTTQINVTIHASLTPVLGSTQGSWQINQKGLARINDAPVVGVASLTNTTVFAQKQDLYLWDGTTYAPTNFSKHLNGESILSITERHSTSFWISTATSIWLFQNDSLRSFSDIKQAKLKSYDSKRKILIATEQKGTFSALQETVNEWRLRSFDGEHIALNMLSVASGEPLTFWGLDTNNQLKLRKANGQQAAWWSFALKPEPTDPATDSVKVQYMVHQKKYGHTWVVSKDSLYLLSEQTALHMPLPTSTGTILAITSSPDGHIWLSDGKMLTRIHTTDGPAPPTTSYATEIKPLINKHKCASCHSNNGKQQPFLTTYQQVKSNVSRMIIRMEDPNNPMPLGNPRVPTSEINTFKRWVQEGHKP